MGSDKYYRCRICRKKFKVYSGFNYNMPRLLNHLRDHHPKRLSELQDLYLRDIIKIAYEKEGDLVNDR